jgi:enterochelin esterase-like enzyme
LGLTLFMRGSRPAAGAGLRIDLGPWVCTETAGQIKLYTVDSASYGQTVPANVYLPPCYDWTPGSLPVIYLLHGANTDETQWPDLNVAPAADALIGQGYPPFVVVMPGGGYFLSLNDETFVIRDLIPGIEGQLRVRRDPAGRAIGGISLGGYWALRTAFEHPELFAAVGGHSPVTLSGQADDPAVLAYTAGLAELHIWLDVGSDDSLRVTTEQLAAALDGRDLGVSMSVNPGGHNRTYWRAHTPQYLRFYLSALAPACDHCNN